MVNHGFRRKEVRHAGKKKYRLCQTTSHSSMLVACQGDVSRKLNHARIAAMNCRTLSSYVRVKESHQLASDRSRMSKSVDTPREMCIDVSCFRDGSFFINETPSPGVVGIGFLLSPRAVKALLFFSFPNHRIGKIVLVSVIDVFTYSVSMHQQQSIITDPSAAHSMTNFPP